MRALNGYFQHGTSLQALIRSDDALPVLHKCTADVPAGSWFACDLDKTAAPSIARSNIIRASGGLCIGSPSAVCSVL